MQPATKVKPTRLYLVRHGAAEGAEGLAVGQIDLPISVAGAASVRRLAATWNGPPPDRLLASDLLRATATAELLGESWGRDLEIDPRLREMSFGDWDGRPWTEIRTTAGTLLDEWMTSWWHSRVPKGEGLHDVAERAVAWLEEILAASPGQTVVAVAHGGSIRTLLCHALQIPLERAFHLHLHHGRVSALATTFRGLEVQLVNAEAFPTAAPAADPPPTARAAAKG